MKKIILFSLLLIIATTTFCQQNDSVPILTKQDYLKKSKNQKTTARILLGGGSLMAAIGISISFVDAVNATSDALVTIVTLGTEQQTTYHDNSGIANVLFYGGLAGIAGSIPLFIASKRNKKTGMSLSFSNQKIPSFQKTSFVYQSIPSLKLKISL